MLSFKSFFFFFFFHAYCQEPLKARCSSNFFFFLLPWYLVLLVCTGLFVYDSSEMLDLSTFYFSVSKPLQHKSSLPLFSEVIDYFSIHQCCRKAVMELLDHNWRHTLSQIRGFCCCSGNRFLATRNMHGMQENVNCTLFCWLTRSVWVWKYYVKNLTEGRIKGVRFAFLSKTSAVLGTGITTRWEKYWES